MDSFLIFFLVALMLACDGRADDSLPGAVDYSQPWQVTSYTKDAGFAQQRIFDIAFSPDGNAWLAADDGLHTFDGFTWSLFGTNNGLPSSFVRAVCVDKHNRLWLGSDAGAGVWDAQRQKYDPLGSRSGLANDNVREIDLDPDGTLWFSCDQWPEMTETPGGLSCLKPEPPPGQWKTFHQTNGLPMDYVIGYFRDSTGRQYALTPHGWNQRQGEKWAPPSDPGYEAEDCVLQMAEARDGTLFAQGEHMLLTLTQGRWQSHPESRSRVICATRAGDMAAAEYDSERGQLWLSLWDGSRFVRASAMVSCQTGGRLYHLREAPDGSLWCVGMGVVARWNFRAGKWTLYSQLPPPMRVDAQGRVWFADNEHTVVYASQHFQTLAPGRLLEVSDAGQGMIWDAQRKELMVTAPQDPAQRTVVTTAFETAQTVLAATNGAFWIVGQDQKGNGLVVNYDNGQTKVISAPGFMRRQLRSSYLMSATQVLIVAQEHDSTRYDIAQVTDENITWLPFATNPPPMTYPSAITAAGRLWLFGYSGLYEQSQTAANHWQPVTEFGGSGFRWPPVADAEEFLLMFSGGSSGRAGCALYFSNHWQRADGEFSCPTLGRDNKTIYLSGRNGVYIRRQAGTLDLEFLQVPGESFVNITVADPSGALWLGTSSGTLRYQPDRIPPHILIYSPTIELRRAKPLPADIHGQRRFEVNSDPASFRYSKRVDAGDWSPFEAWPGMSWNLPALKSGSHVLEVRVRDVDGNVSATPTAVKFTVLPEPLQNQPWFMPLVLLVAALLAWLVWLSIAHVRQMAQTNTVLSEEITIRRRTQNDLQRARDELEQRVIERTAELTRANQSLNHEIAERKQAEETQRRLEEQLRQSQKMEAIGTLAGGIAHDFNNLLAVIIPYCHLILDDVSDRPDLRFQLEEVLKAANRGKNLVQQILTFSRRQRQERRVVDLQPTIKETLKLLRSALPSTIQIDQHINSTPPVLADPTQIHQVIMNLCVNAQHAMEGSQGRLEIGLDDVRVDEALCSRSADLHPGHYVRLTVRDNGCGMSPDIQNRIFEPFFTTKETGRGTGLGLSVVHGIVQSHDGAILVQSRPGKGATFEVFLPAQTGAVDNIAEPPRTVFHGKGEHILIVDDEPGITQSLKRVLSRIGYRVIIYNDPRMAFNHFAARPADTEIILTDLTMPGMTGLDFARKVFAIRPELPVVLATGYGGDLVSPAQLSNHPNIRKVLEKPLDPRNVIQTVTEILKSDRQT